MPEQFEYFAKKEEGKQKEVSPEKHQKAIEYAKELKVIKDKESPTEEDLKRVKELIRKIERIYPKEKFESISAKEKYQELKQTPLYDQEKKEWNWYMDEDGQLKSSNRYSEIQLSGVLAEAMVGDIEEAKEKYQELKQTPLYDQEKKQWNYYMGKDGQLKNSGRYSGAQLSGVLAEAMVGDIEEAKEKYQKLKQTPLYDQEKKEWNWDMDKDGQFKDPARFSGVQLLGVLAEAMVGDIEEAKEKYQKLKQTPLYDQKKKEWNYYIDKGKDGQLKSPERFPEVQLLGVLAEAMVGDIEEAKEKYQELKQTPLYDQEKKEWNWYMDEDGQLKSSDRDSHAQLLGVLAGAIVEKGEEFKNLWFP